VGGPLMHVAMPSQGSGDMSAKNATRLSKTFGLTPAVPGVFLQRVAV
jgi:hypothetical protein